MIHIVGGGARNRCSVNSPLTRAASRSLAGPVEATALGNVLVQARTLGAPLSDLATMRALLRATQDLQQYEPRGDAAAWQAAEVRIYGS